MALIPYTAGCGDEADAEADQQQQQSTHTVKACNGHRHYWLLQVLTKQGSLARASVSIFDRLLHTHGAAFSETAPAVPLSSEPNAVDEVLPLKPKQPYL